MRDSIASPLLRLLSAATNFSGVEMSGFGAPAFTASPIRLRPSGVNCPITPPSSASDVINWNGRTMTSGGGVLLVISSTMVPIPTVLMPTVFFVSFENARAMSGRPELNTTPGVRTLMSAVAYSPAVGVVVFGFCP